MEPLISIRIHDQHRPFQPGEVLRCEYQIDVVEPDDLHAVEASVLWHTEGKGEEDMAVHHFERHTPQEVETGDLRSLRKMEVPLPNSPLTYAGVTVKIRWCVRVRAYLGRGRAVFFEQPFVLGDIPSAKAITEHEAPTNRVADPAKISGH